MTETAQTVNIQRSGMDFLGWLTLLFIALKLMGHITWGWEWVLAPLWMPIAAIIGFCVAAIAICIALIVVGVAIGGVVCVLFLIGAGIFGLLDALFARKPTCTTANTP